MYSSKLHYTTLPPQVTQQLVQLFVFVNIAGFQAGDLHFWVTRLLTLRRVSTHVQKLLLQILYNSGRYLAI